MWTLLAETLSSLSTGWEEGTTSQASESTFFPEEVFRFSGFYNGEAALKLPLLPREPHSQRVGTRGQSTMGCHMEHQQHRAVTHPFSESSGWHVCGTDQAISKKPAQPMPWPRRTFPHSTAFSNI